MKLKQFLLCAIAALLPLSVNAASNKSNDRWFDVEVILFSQLGDKSQLKESFPDSSELPKYRSSTDLLARYLNPDIASLKQLLPSCDSPQYKPDLVTQNAKLPALFSEKSLAEIAQMPPLVAESSALNEFSTTNSFSDETSTGETATDTLASQNNNAANNSLATPLTTELSDEKRAEIQALVVAADEEFNRLTFNYTAKVAPTSAQRRSPITLCRIDEVHFAELKANDASFAYNGFTVDKMPLLINAPEDIDNNSTHLLSKESLKLGDVITDLRYSKNFRPLLHMGWRQVARPKKQSIPVKVYAGDNFAADYQKQVAKYQTQQNKLHAALTYDDNQENPAELSPADKPMLDSQGVLLAQAKQARIARIVEQISTVTEDTEQLISAIESDDLSLETDIERRLIDEEQTAPIPPVQDWFLNGFFNVHLKHYLFITADFNILDKNLAELATAQLAGGAPTSAINSNVVSKAPVQAKAIRFKQDRRVISGEVHYFDHPYMGMIVQIRPYKKPKPEQDK